MIDLQAFKETTEELKLFDGEIVNLKKPTQKLIIDMMAFEDSVKKKNNVNIMDTLGKLLLSILNNNIENKQFKIDYINENFTPETMMIFMKSYSEFAQNIQNQAF